MPANVSSGTRENVSLAEVDRRVQTPSAFHHLGRQINAADFRAAVVQVTGKVTRSGPDVANQRTALDAFRESIKKLSIKRLVMQIIVNAPDILVSDAAIAFVQIADDGLLHRLTFRARESICWAWSKTTPKER
jgi:hypothetical protein